MKLPLPIDTQNILIGEKQLPKADNLGLLLNKYVFAWEDNWELKGKTKYLEKIADIKSCKVAGDTCVAAIKDRQKAMRQSLENSGYHVERLEMTTDSRLIIGLGGTSVIETGMTLHPLYGFPYLPGSGLKGLTRAYAEIAEVASTEELHVIFGSEDKSAASSDNIQGRVFFMDGLPNAFPKLDLDIMNPHYSDYYQGNKPPADYLNPVPVTFLAVAAGQQFTFGLYSRDKELVAKAKEWLIGGLTQLGAGGKTNVGYGYFRIDTDRTQPVISKEQSVESKRIEHIKDNSLTTRLKTVINPQTFIEFIKSIKPDEIEELRNISFKDSGINIGYARELGLADVTEDIKKLIAAKILEITTPNKKWDEKKHERYRKLHAIAGLNNV